jgi:predicted metal-dependent HD superfamily phosphohydrolase
VARPEREPLETPDGDPAAVEALLAALAKRHGEPHRRYHTVEHVEEVRREVARLVPHEPEADATAVALAAWFHDAIYDPNAAPGASEEASAALAVAEVTALTGDGARAAEVARLVRLTAGHRVEPDDRSGAVLVDADLWILSSPPERYDRYAVDVRAEHAHVPEARWVEGRGAVLRRFLDAAAELYVTGPDPDRRARRRRAVANLTRELSALEE